jgi:hypothetical protein
MTQVQGCTAGADVDALVGVLPRTSKPNQLMPFMASTLPSTPMMFGPCTRTGVSARSMPTPGADIGRWKAAPATLTRLHLRPFWKIAEGTRPGPAHDHACKSAAELSKLQHLELQSSVSGAIDRVIPGAASRMRVTGTDRAPLAGTELSVSLMMPCRVSTLAFMHNIQCRACRCQRQAHLYDTVDGDSDVDVACVQHPAKPATSNGSHLDVEVCACMI